MLVKIQIFFAFVFVLIVFWATGAAAQQAPDRCSKLKYSKSQYSQFHKRSKPYRFNRIEGQAVFAPISQKWDSGTDGVCVAVFNRNDGRLVAAVGTHDGGQFQFGKLEPGRYTLVAAVEENQSQEIAIPVRLDNAFDKVAVGENVTGQRLLLHMRLKEDKRKSFVTVITNPALREGLLQMVEEDQAIREEWIKAGVDRPQESLIQRMSVIDGRNLVRMKAIVKKYGWLGPETVGVDGTAAAFLLVQHAEHAFQKRMLPRLRNAFRAGKLAGPDYALLLDRVLVGEGKPQIYGTQAKLFDQWKGKEPVLYPIEDEHNVDKRRAEVGLGPLAEYVKGLQRIYFPQEKQ